jgi:putative tricarboxylic transport membrane protein
MILQVALNIFTSQGIIMVLCGVILGIIIGAIPGLGAPIGITVLLPFTYAMTPLNALLLLASVYMGCAVGGSISGILLNVPGTAESVCTTIEGYPMARKGRAKEALYFAAIASTFGGIFGGIILLFFAPALARAALKFGPAEMALTSIIGITIIGSLSSQGLLKGIFAACFGMIVSFVGLDIVTGSARLTFGFPILTMGFKQVALALGLIAGREMLIQTHTALNNGWLKKFVNQNTQVEVINMENISPFKILKTIFRHPFNIIRSSIIGTFIGILPGAGINIAAYVAYGEAKRNAKEPFGNGNPEGIIAPESANNAAVGGTIVPMLALGIPGSPSCALLFGALTIHGIAVGPNLFSSYGELCYGFMLGLILSAVMMGILSILFVPTFSQIIRFKMVYIIPIVVACVILGGFSIRNNMYDVFSAFGFMLIGFIFIKADIPIAPAFLGNILGPLIEQNLIQSLTIAGAAKKNFFSYAAGRPLCIFIAAAGILLLWLNIKSIQSEKKTKREIGGK